MKPILLIILMAGSILSCTNPPTVRFENAEPHEKTLQIITKILTSHSLNFMQDFPLHSDMGLYIVSEKSGFLYKGNKNYRNIQIEDLSINNKQQWHPLPNVYLDSEPVAVYAYYPYQKQAGLDATRIPVKIEPDAALTRDYMYGIQATGQKAVNNLSPVVLLDMNHALSLLSFQLKITAERGKENFLQAIQIGNKAGGTTLCFRGEMNIKTGKISGCAGTNASTRLKLDSPERLSSEYGKMHSIKIIPDRLVHRSGDVEILFVIDRKTYVYPVPSSTRWRKGYRYFYQLSFDGKNLRLENVAFRKWLRVEE